MALHCTLNGLRGFLAPAAGVSLYRLAEHLLPGQGPLALLIPLGLTVWGAFGFAAMARRPLPQEEEASPPALALPPWKGALS